MRFTALALLSFVAPLSGCETVTDADGDGHNAIADGGADCDDNNADVHPGKTEVLAQCNNGIDEDCTDGDLACACTDADEDGFDPISCGGTDCDDTHPGVNPSIDEASLACGNGLDEDCDGIDQNCTELWIFEGSATIDIDGGTLAGATVMKDVPLSDPTTDLCRYQWPATGSPTVDIVCEGCDFAFDLSHQNVTLREGPYCDSFYSVDWDAGPGLFSVGYHSSYASSSGEAPRPALMILHRDTNDVPDYWYAASNSTVSWSGSTFEWSFQQGTYYYYGL